MEHVNNDMDDLFRKAGDLYPLKSNESDWDSVLDKIREASPGEQNNLSGLQAEGKTNRRKWGLVFLLLLPLAVGTVAYFSSEKTNSNLSSKKINLKNPVPEIAASPAVPAKSSDAVVETASDKKTGFPKAGTAAMDVSPAGSSRLKRTTSGISSGRNKKPENAGYNENKETGSAEVDKLKSAPSNEAAAVIGSASGTSVASAARTQTPVAAASQNAASANAASKDSMSKTDAVKKEVPKTKTTAGFYIGLLGGPDWTSVKFQSVNQTGYSAGLLAGYRFNKHFAVETGLMLDKKFYYSSGEYFNTSKTGIPVNEPVNSVSGNCSMFEIPINFQYDFATGKNHHFFANAGLSSYLMKKETYSIIYQGSNTWAYPDTSYYNSTRNFLSVLQLSAGYERAIGPKTNIRVEPYLKIPLQGIGIGSMPIASAGIYFGITYSFK